MVFKKRSNMRCGRAPLYFMKANFLYFILIFDIGCNGQALGPVCNGGQKHFLPPAEQNAAYTCMGAPTICSMKNSKYYTLDGSCNNLEHPQWGKMSTGFTRLLPAFYSDGNFLFRKSRDGSPLPNARVISNTLFIDQNVLSNEYNLMFYGFGQWIDHDVTLSLPQVAPVLCCSGTKPKANPPEGICLAVTPPPDDPYYSKFRVTCVDTKRSINSLDLGCKLKPISQINFQTSWLDLSLLYGPSTMISNTLRLFRNGHLRTGPKQTSGQDFPFVIPVGCPVGGLQPTPGGSCLASGDPRLQQNPELSVNEITFFRMHNHIADGLKKANPTWNDNQLFNEARRILIAKYQHVVFAEVVPALIGPKLAAEYGLLPQSKGYESGYNADINGQVVASFSAATGRVFHSLVRGSASYKNDLGQIETYSLGDKYFNQKFLLQGNTFTEVIRSYVNTECGAQDQHTSVEIRNHLFITETQIFGQDLISLDILRGRDFGLAPYNEYRKACGLCPFANFQQLVSIITNPAMNIPLLQKLYKNIEDVDLYVLGILEKPLPGALVGPTISCLLAETLRRLKFGDRLYYGFSSSGFTEAQLQDIRKTTFSQFLCLTNNITAIQPESMKIISPTNREAPCSQYGDVDYSLFK